MKTSIINITVVVIFSLILNPLFAQKDYVGHYKTNFAEIGFFSSHIELSSDNSFKYEFQGDMCYDYCEGTFEMKNDTLTLQVTKTSNREIYLLDSLLIDFGDNYENIRPLKYYYSSNKLFPINRATGEIKKAKNSKDKFQKFFLRKEKNNFYRWRKINIE